MLKAIYLPTKTFKCNFNSKNIYLIKLENKRKFNKLIY